MTTLTDTGEKRVFQTQAMTDHGLADFWLDEFGHWHVGVDDPDFSAEVESFSWDAIQDVLAREQQVRAFDAMETYLAREFRSLNETLKRFDGAGSPEWQEAFDRCAQMYGGLSHYLNVINMVNDEIVDRDQGFVFETRTFTLGRAGREFELRGLSHWVEMPSESPVDPDAVAGDGVTLADVLDVASNVDRRKVIAAHMDLLEVYAERLRDLLNMIRAGMRLSQGEVDRIGHWGNYAATLARELDSF